MSNIIKSIVLADGTELDSSALRHMYVNSKGNLVIETVPDTDTSNGNINIESQKNIQLKPGGSGDVRIYSDHTGDAEECTIHCYDGTKTVTGATDDIPVRLKLNTTEIELTKKDARNRTTGEYITDTGIDIKFKPGNKSNDSYTPAKIKARSIDLRCEEHGGIALQPAGADSSGKTNKIKLEHSLKVPVEHFSTYTTTGSTTTTTYNFSEDAWFCVGQAIGSSSNEQAFQIFGKKVLNKTSTQWNDDMQDLGSSYFGIIDSNDCKWAIGYATSNSSVNPTNAAASGTTTAMTGNYIYIKRLAQTGRTFSTRDIIKVSTTSGTTKYVITTEDSGTVISTSQTGTAITSTIFGNITRGNTSYTVSASGEVTIDLIEYIVTSSQVSLKEDSSKVFTITGGKFTISPIYPYHYATEGGMGIEWGTLNPLHTSIYSKDYRFKKDAPIYAVSRGTVAASSSGKVDYPTQSDDFKDIIENAQPSVTWTDIINAVSYLKKQGVLPTDGSFLT